jgi:hypothetical protein
MTPPKVTGSPYDGVVVMAHRITLLAALLVVVGACSAAPPTSTPTADVRAELHTLIEDVTASTDHRYRLADDRGVQMGGAKIIWIPEALTFAAVYFSWDEQPSAFVVALATSDDLVDWTWRADYAVKGSQPTIAPMEGGGYALAWEQEPDPIHNVIESYASWDDLLADRPDRHFDVPITMPACGEGTPDIVAASPRRVDVTFHYHGDCERDREAQGSTDWSAWTSMPRPDIDQALIARGVAGHIGDRDGFEYRGRRFSLIEGQLRLDDWSAWRVFLYDPWTGAAEPLAVRTHAGSTSMANPTIEPILIAGQDAILVTLYLFTEGARGEEDGPLLYYRTLPAASVAP